MSEKTPEQIVRDYLSYLRNPQKATNNGFSARLRGKLNDEADVITQLRLLSAIEIAEQVDGEELRDGFIAVAKTYAMESGLTTGSFLQFGVSEEVLQAAGLLSESGVVDLRASSGKSAVTTTKVAAKSSTPSKPAKVAAPVSSDATEADDEWESAPRVLATESSSQMNGSAVAVLMPPEVDDAEEIFDAEDIDTYGTEEEVDETDDAYTDDAETDDAEPDDAETDDAETDDAEPVEEESIDAEPVEAESSAPRGRVTQAQIRQLLPDEPFTMKSLSELTGASILTVRKAMETLMDKNVIKPIGQDPDYKGVGRSPIRYIKKPS